MPVSATPVAQREQPGGLDEGQDAEQFQVHLAAMVRVRTLGREPPEPAQRGSLVPVGAVDLAQERIVAGGARGDVLPESRRQPRIAPSQAKVEEDVEVEQRVGPGPAAPGVDLLPPARQRPAPLRVGRHHPAVAIGQPHRIQIARQALGERGEPAVGVLAQRFGAVLDNKAVILVGGQEVLVAAARSHDDHREPGRRGAEPFVLHRRHVAFEQAGVDVVVDVAQRRLNVADRDIPVEQGVGHPDLGGLDFAQPVIAVVAREVVDRGHHVARRPGHGVVQVEDAGEAAFAVHHRHMAMAQPAHPGDGDEEMFVLADTADRVRHHVAHRLFRPRRRKPRAGRCPRSVTIPAGRPSPSTTTTADALSVAMRPTTSRSGVSTASTATGGRRAWSRARRKKISVAIGIAVPALRPHLSPDLNTPA